jgi:two-component system cell cycle sensor histidine kinase/response regulator CckA
MEPSEPQTSTILLVEDDPATRHVLVQLLQARGYRVIPTSSGEEGLRRLSEVDLVLLDGMLPGRDGWDICREIKEQHDPLLPVIMVTARAEADAVVRTFGVGADDYVAKPFRSVELLARIESRLRVRRTEEALQESEERYRKFFEDDITGDYISTPEGRLLACNAAFARIFGFDSVEEALASRTTSIYPSPEAREAFLQLLRRERTLELHELELRRRDGAAVHVVENVIGIFDEQGELTSFKGYMFDITERKALEEQLLQSQRLQAVGQLAGGVAHDFNNLLTVIRGNAALGLLDASDVGSESGYFGEIDRAAVRAAELTQQLLAFSRRQVLLPKVLDLNAVVRDMYKMLQRVIGEDIELITSAHPDLSRVKADPGQIEQVIVNLAVNARDAMPQGGTLIIETADAELDEHYSRRYGYVRTGSYVMLAVSDTGSGMSPETRARVFEPFFTTKAEGKGTGLGLSTVYGIVKQSGGYIWVYSELGHGTTVKIYLPRENPAAEEADQHRGPREAPRGSETVLLIEDEDTVRALARRVLERSGYAVIEARDGEEALMLAERDGDKLDLVVTDVVMPRMSGRVVAERLAEHRPGLPVLFMSGYTDDAVMRHGILASGAAFLQKPFTPHALALKVREVLDANRARPSD